MRRAGLIGYKTGAGKLGLKGTNTPEGGGGGGGGTEGSMSKNGGRRKGMLGGFTAPESTKWLWFMKGKMRSESTATEDEEVAKHGE
ncbi:uncharacterized protein G2W53_006171 [Senna tora]|uniref:Uncharacterized protein n=1 Tax=Senna tora TaxID=362788 RepID=A0A835CCP1_9FABA|nr:uncharacterized protein G2W53_006171 [Senna tora]